LQRPARASAQRRLDATLGHAAALLDDDRRVFASSSNVPAESVRVTQSARDPLPLRCSDKTAGASAFFAAAASTNPKEGTVPLRFFVPRPADAEVVDAAQDQNRAHRPSIPPCIHALHGRATAGAKKEGPPDTVRSHRHHLGRPARITRRRCYWQNFAAVKLLEYISSDDLVTVSLILPRAACSMRPVAAIECWPAGSSKRVPPPWDSGQPQARQAIREFRRKSASRRRRRVLPRNCVDLAERDFCPVRAFSAGQPKHFRHGDTRTDRPPARPSPSLVFSSSRGRPAP